LLIRMRGNLRSSAEFKRKPSAHRSRNPCIGDSVHEIRKMKKLNAFLDNLVRPEIHLFCKRMLAFQVCGIAGFAVAAVVAVGSSIVLGLKLTVIAALIVTAVLTCLGVVMATKWITGEEQIVYYHHEIAVMVVSALAVRLLVESPLAYLDITIL